MLTRYSLAILALTLALASWGCGGGGRAVAAAPSTNHFVPNGKSINGKVVNMAAAVTIAQATAAAIAAQPGTAGTVELGDEDGVAVYDVHVTAADGKQYDVKVDATTGKYIKTDADTGVEGTEGSSTPDADGATGPNDQH